MVRVPENLDVDPWTVIDEDQHTAQVKTQF